MDGAFFARNLLSDPPDGGLPLLMGGYIGEKLAWVRMGTIHFYSRTFITAGDGAGVAIDRLDIRQSTIRGYGGFMMDDFHYTLVPGPSALGLLGFAGLLARRRR